MRYQLRIGEVDFELWSKTPQEPRWTKVSMDLLGELPAITVAAWSEERCEEERNKWKGRNKRGGALAPTPEQNKNQPRQPGTEGDWAHEVEEELRDKDWTIPELRLPAVTGSPAGSA